MLAVQQLSDQETITEVCIFFLQLLKNKTTRHHETDDDSSTSKVRTFLNFLSKLISKLITLCFLQANHSRTTAKRKKRGKTFLSRNQLH